MLCDRKCQCYDLGVRGDFLDDLSKSSRAISLRHVALDEIYRQRDEREKLPHRSPSLLRIKPGP